MKHAGKAQHAALRLILLALGAVLLLVLVGFLARVLGAFVVGLAGFLVTVWVLFTLFTLYFFRDPEPDVPRGAGLVVSPAHAKVDAIDTIQEPAFMGGECRRISMFLSVIDVHVQRAPVAGRVALVKHTAGQFLNAMRTDSALFNENVLVGIEVSEPGSRRIGVRLIAGLLARRIVPWAGEGDAVQRGERISLIQFGSRADVYLPHEANIKVKLGDKVVGGETILATFD